MDLTGRDGSAHPELGGRIDELEVDLLEVPTTGVDHQRLAKGYHTLLGTGNAALEHQKVVPHDTIVGETSHRRDPLLRNIRLRRGVRLVVRSTNTEDLLVDLSTMVVPI